MSNLPSIGGKTIGTKITGEDIAYIRKRIFYRVKIAFNQGVGLFLFGILLIMVSGQALKLVVALENDSVEKMQKYFATPLLARDTDKHPFLVSLIVSGVQGNLSAKESGCERSLISCRRGELVLDRTVRLAQLLAAAVSKWDESEAEQKKVVTPTDGSQKTELESIPAELEDKIRRVLVDDDVNKDRAENTAKKIAGAFSDVLEPTIREVGSVANDDVRQLDEACEDETTKRHGTRFDLGPPWCHGNSGEWKTQAMLPQQVNEVNRVERRVRLAKVVSLALEGAVSDFRGIDQSSSQEDDSTPALDLVQAYYISVDSVLRIWQKTRSTDERSKLPRNRLWASSSYFTRYMDDKDKFDRYVTPPYLDVGGFGVVQTVCRSIPVSEKARLKLGIVCFDLALTQEGLSELLSSLQSSPLVEAGRMCLQGSALRVGKCPTVDDSPVENSDVHERLKQLVIELNRRREDIAQLLDGSEFVEHSIAGDKWYLQNIGSDGSGMAIVAIKSQVGEQRYLFDPIVWVAFCFGGGLFLLTIAAYQSRSLSKSEEVLARLRTLSIGVVETDVSDKIVGANDRAEELLEIPLTRFGLPGGNTPSLWEFLDKEHLYRIREGDPKKLDANSIARDRSKGYDSEYFARRNQPGLELAKSDWYEMHAGAVLTPLPGARLTKRRRMLGVSATFGTIKKLEPNEVAHLISQIKPK